LITTLCQAGKRIHGDERRHQKYAENHVDILAMQDRDHKPVFVDFHPLLL